MTAGSLKDHYYIGQHTTNDLNDGYKGSGNIVRKYYKKHPLDYTKEILYFCNDKEELNRKEKELIEPHLGKDYCLNIAVGGAGGDTSSGCHRTEETRAKMSAAKKGKMSGDKNPMYGKRHTEETRIKISAAKKGKYIGDKSPSAKPITIQNTITNEILCFDCIKDCAEYLQVDVRGTFRIKFLKSLPTRVPQLKNWRVI